MQAVTTTTLVTCTAPEECQAVRWAGFAEVMP